MTERGSRRSQEACGRLPLGAGALAGVNFDTDRRAVAAALGSPGSAENSIDAVSNRDFVLDYLAAAATCATHLSRLGAEIVLWSSEEFGFCEVSDAWASGSSIMPQKKNPDAAELLRAKAPRLAANLSALYGVMHGLPLTYNKDMQEDKERLFDSCDTLELCLEAADGMIGSIAFRRERLAAAASDQLLAATDIADLLVRRGMPFREAHGVVAGLVRTAVSEGKALSELTPGSWPLNQTCSMTSSTPCSVTARGWRRRSLRAARASPGCASSSPAPVPHCAEPVDRAFYDRPVVEVAQELVGCVLHRGETAGVIVETEAYHESEAACHAYIGLTRRTATLFGRPGSPTCTAPTASTRWSMRSANPRAWERRCSSGRSSRWPESS